MINFISTIISIILLKIDSTSAFDVVFIVFLMLKLVGVVSWSWFIIFLPLIIWVIIVLIEIIIILSAENNKYKIPDADTFMNRMEEYGLEDIVLKEKEEIKDEEE